MKKLNIELFLGCCVIGACVLASGIIIAQNLPQTAHFPTSIAVTTADSSAEFDAFLSVYEATAFLKISEEEFEKLMASGELNLCFAKLQDTYVFSKENLESWANGKMGLH